MSILAELGPQDLAEAWAIAEAADPRWRTKLARGRARLGAAAEETLARKRGRA